MERDLASELRLLSISTADFAKLVRVTVRAVNMWIKGEREIPGPVRAYLSLFSALPKAIQAQELARIREEDTSMYEGMYSIAFRGREGFGAGILVLQGGQVFGSDGAVSYDGHYEPSRSTKGHLDVTLKVTVPAGVALVLGRSAQPAAYWFDVRVSFPAQDNSSFKLETPYGRVDVAVSYLRALPAELAA
jgi:hypothetical protein